MSCTPLWYNESSEISECPYGAQFPGEVTVPREIGFLDAVAVYYSLSIFLIVFGLIIFACCVRGTKEVNLALCPICLVILIEYAIKPWVAQPRPGANGGWTENGVQVGSCNTSCGMPSSHAAIAVGLFTLLFLDLVFRTIPMRDTLIVTESMLRANEATDVPAPFLHGTATRDQFVRFVVVCTVFLLPIPTMRVVLHDHTVEQVIVGSIIGVVFSCAWFRVTLTLVEMYHGSLGMRLCCSLITHNYAPARLSVSPRRVSNTVSAPTSNECC
eukprot:TRINITY_DN29664_c0_g1_i1.p1 TRINITY_DN29664_c0_g1~~TRINITY_DN29664_c0_g1_i1.p1  ORF type:complete len:271 (+),score=7.18 TRINITY_DN29664_c0_g1_i1:60-872(+)